MALVLQEEVGSKLSDERSLTKHEFMQPTLCMILEE